MTALRGHAWISSFGQVGGSTFKVWCNSLKYFSPKQIADGLARYLKSADSFLDCVKFRGYCEDLANKPHQINSQAYAPYQRCLDSQTFEERKAVAKPWLEQLKKSVHAGNLKDVKKQAEVLEQLRLA